MVSKYESSFRKNMSESSIFIYLFSLENFFDFTSDLVSFYKNNNITPVIESDFSSSKKLDSVYSFLENER